MASWEARVPRRNSRAGGSAFLTPPPPRVIAHRGLAIGAPENTLLAFAKALSLGVEIIETDVHESSDGVAILCHDESLERVAARAVKVSHLTATELSRVELGMGQNFATLSEALDAFPQARFNIDVKSPGAVNPTVKAILAAGATHRVLVTSFSDARRRATVELLPGVATSAGLVPMARALSLTAGGMRRAAMSLLSEFDAVQIPERWKGIPVLSSRLIRNAHSVGTEVHVWTVNDPDAMHKFLDLGVDGMVTDRADLAMEVIRSRTQ